MGTFANLLHAWSPELRSRMPGFTERYACDDSAKHDVRVMARHLTGTAGRHGGGRQALKGSVSENAKKRAVATPCIDVRFCDAALVVRSIHFDSPPDGL